MQRLKLFYREKLLEILKKSSKEAADALSSMIQGKEVIPNLTSINLRPMDGLFMLPDDNIVVISDIIGDLGGVMIASFKGKDGLKIINTMLQRDVNLTGDLGKEEIGVLKEYINVVGGIFLTEFGNAVGFRAMPEVPKFEGKFKEVSKLLISQLKAINERILFINSSMNVISLNADAVFYVLFEGASLAKILKVVTQNDIHPFEEEL